MCGIYAHFRNNIEEARHYNAIQKRGPDNTVLQNVTPNVIFLFSYTYD
jgi:hypothetical protein